MIFKSIFLLFRSNSVNFYGFIGFITFNIEVHELFYVYSFLVDRILVSNFPRATVRRLSDVTRIFRLGGLKP